MSTKTFVLFGMFIGSIIGQFVPAMFGVSIFSFASFFWSGVGSIIGIYIAYRFANS